MRIVTIVIAWLALVGQVMAQERVIGPQAPAVAAWSSPEAELHAAAVDLHKLAQANIPIASGGYTLSEQRYFSLYAVPPERRATVLSALQFWVNSLSTSGKGHLLEPVDGTDGLLYRGYISNYRWTTDAWEKISLADPFFREPWVSARDAKYLRYVAGNAIVRADWFVDYTSDTVRSNGYYQLLYCQAQVTRNGRKINLLGKAPANAREFREVWDVRLDILKKYSIDRGAIVPSGTSIVAFNNRILWRVPQQLGYYWQTFDVSSQVGRRDFVENRFPTDWEASEYITSMPNGMQAYFLTNGTVDRNGRKVKNPNTRVEFADPSIAHDPNLSREVTVRTSQSCVFCHNQGILTPRELLPEYAIGGVKLNEYSKKVSTREEEFYYANTNRAVRLDQLAYNTAMADTIGITGTDNTKNFLSTINYYRADVSLAQATRECGADSIAEMQAALSFTTKGRLAAMATQETPIPRDSWDADLFHVAKILLMEYRRQK